jgi:hypothetical protein
VLVNAPGNYEPLTYAFSLKLGEYIIKFRYHMW